jgi:hypothetical protein
MLFPFSFHETVDLLIRGFGVLGFISRFFKFEVVFECGGVDGVGVEWFRNTRGVFAEFLFQFF